MYSNLGMGLFVKLSIYVLGEKLTVSTSGCRVLTHKASSTAYSSLPDQNGMAFVQGVAQLYVRQAPLHVEEILSPDRQSVPAAWSAQNPRLPGDPIEGEVRPGRTCKPHTAHSHTK